MGARRGGRDESPLAGLLRRSPRREEEAGRPVRDAVREERAQAAQPRPVDEAPASGGEAREEVQRGAGAAGRAVKPQTKPQKKRRGRPRGGRRSNPDYVQISARIHKEVRFSLERVLAERSALEGRYVEMAEVIEDLMRFYVEHGDPREMLGKR